MTQSLSLRLCLATLVAAALFVTGVNPQEARAAAPPPSAVAVSVTQTEPAPERPGPSAEPRAFPVLIVLAVLARVGISAVIKQYGKAQLKKAAKSYLLNSINANKWHHIMQSKHKWSSVGAKSKSQIAEIMSSAMANGKHVVHKNGSMKAVWKYKGKTIGVTYNKNGGQISDGWVE